MSKTVNDLLTHIARLRFAGEGSRVHSVETLSSFHSLLESPYVNNAGEALSVWQMRHQNADITGVVIPGAPALIANLKQLPPETEIDQFGFTGDKLVGCIFFHHQTGEFLGDTIVERRPKSQAMVDLEDQLIDPVSLALARSGSSRKSA